MNDNKELVKAIKYGFALLSFSILNTFPDSQPLTMYITCFLMICCYIFFIR
jgi:hypothetical protein